MSCAAARINNATDWQIPLATARGILISAATLRLCSINTKNEAGRFNIIQPQIQARPCLIVLAARPGNLPERRFSLAGLTSSASGRFMAGEAQRNKFQGLLLLCGPAKQDC